MNEPTGEKEREMRKGEVARRARCSGWNVSACLRFREAGVRCWLGVR